MKAMTRYFNHTSHAFAIVFVLVAMLFSCKKDVEPDMETFAIVGEKITSLNGQVKISGSYSYTGKIDGLTLQLSREESMGAAISHPVPLSGKSFAVTLDSLTPGATYYYRYRVDYGALKPYLTEVKSFTTQSESPAVRTLELLAIDSTTYRVKCEVLSGGGQEVTERGICWNTYGDPTMDDETLKHAQGGLGQYTIKLENLSLSTKYYVRAYAKNDAGTGLSDVLEFRTGSETQKPQVSTVEVTAVTATSASCLCNVSSDGGLELMEIGVCWSLDADPTLNNSHVAATEASLGVFQMTMTSLAPNKTYHVRAYAINAKGTAYGEDLTFTTTAGLPTVVTSGITDITATSAKGGGEVTDEGASPVTDRGLCWSTSHNPTLNDHTASAGGGTGSFTVQMTGLTPNATYYVRAYATNTQGTVYGAEVEFTAQEGLPEVETLDMSDIAATTAKAHGRVTQQGGSDVTERGICWGMNLSPTVNDQHATNGTGAGEYTVDMTGLTPGTKYYVRAYAKNSQGMSYGGQKEFTTEATLPTVVTGTINGIVVTAEVTNSGGAAVTERGVCWSTHRNPTTDDPHGNNGTGVGTYTVELTDLQPGTTYYVRAYALVIVEHEEIVDSVLQHILATIGKQHLLFRHAVDFAQAYGDNTFLSLVVDTGIETQGLWIKTLDGLHHFLAGLKITSKLSNGGVNNKRLCVLFICEKKRKKKGGVIV